MIEIHDVDGNITVKANSVEEALRELGRMDTDVPLHFFDLELKGADLVRWNLHHAYFNQVRFIDTSLRNADLINVVFRSCELANVDLTTACLRSAKFIDCNISNCDFAGANLTNVTANFSMMHCRFDGANLQGTDFSLGDEADGNSISDKTVLSCGVPYDEFLSDVVPYLLQAGGVPLEKTMGEVTWDCHSWDNCPMRVAFNASGNNEIPPQFRPLAKQFIELFDFGLITRDSVMKHVGPLLNKQQD